MAAANARSFADEVAASLPSGLALPKELRKALEWCERAGCVNTYNNTGARYAFIYPGGWRDHIEGRSIVTFQLCDRDMALHWTFGDQAAADRLAPIVRTGGDGSYAALWRDDGGETRIVHMGSGSGSTMLGIYCDTPLDLVRLMAIGYEELCWQECYDKTPEQAFAASSMFDRPGHVVRPGEFRRFVETTFGVTVPERAGEIVRRHVAEMGDADQTDPFARWLKSLEAR